MILDSNKLQLLLSKGLQKESINDFGTELKTYYKLSSEKTQAEQLISLGFIDQFNSSFMRSSNENHIIQYSNIESELALLPDYFWLGKKNIPTGFYRKWFFKIKSSNLSIPALALYRMMKEIFPGNFSIDELRRQDSTLYDSICQTDETLFFLIPNKTYLLDPKIKAVVKKTQLNFWFTKNKVWLKSNLIEIWNNSEKNIKLFILDKIQLYKNYDLFKIIEAHSNNRSKDISIRLFELSIFFKDTITLGLFKSIIPKYIQINKGEIQLSSARVDRKIIEELELQKFNKHDHVFDMINAAINYSDPTIYIEEKDWLEITQIGSNQKHQRLIHSALKSAIMNGNEKLILHFMSILKPSSYTNLILFDEASLRRLYWSTIDQKTINTLQIALIDNAISIQNFDLFENIIIEFPYGQINEKWIEQYLDYRYSKLAFDISIDSILFKINSTFILHLKKLINNQYDTKNHFHLQLLNLIKSLNAMDAYFDNLTTPNA